MLLSAVSVLVVAQSSSEIPEGLMNNPVLQIILFFDCVTSSFILFLILMSVLTLRFESVIIYASEGCKFQVFIVPVTRLCDTVRQLLAESRWHFKVKSCDFLCLFSIYSCRNRDFSPPVTVAVTWPVRRAVLPVSYGNSGTRPRLRWEKVSSY